MAAITRVSTVNELKQIFIELLINNSTKISKVSNQSTNNGIAFGVAKIAQKALKDIAIAESHQFPDSAFGVTLDTVADNYGISARFGASQSSVYLRVVGDPGTVYVSGIQTFSGGGVVFDLEEDMTVSISGYGYVKVRSSISGKRANVPALTINSVSPAPIGHKYVVNEYGALYGRDSENDQLLRMRIKEGGNLASRGTLAYITQVFIKINSNILKVYHQGTDIYGDIVLAIATQNGIDLTPVELGEIKQRASEYLSLVDLNPLTGNNGVSIVNIIYEPIDISMRIQIDISANVSRVREELQINISKYLDFRLWVPGSVFEWDDVLQIVKDHPAVQYVPDTFFFPNQDIVTDPLKLPRVRGFLLLNLDGIIMDGGNNLNPIYYPVDADFSFQSTILSSI